MVGQPWASLGEAAILAVLAGNLAFCHAAISECRHESAVQGFAIVPNIAGHHDAVHTNGMNWLVVFILIPYFLALHFKRKTSFQLLAAFCELALLFGGEFTSAAILWLAMLVLAFFLPNSSNRRR